MGYYYQGRWAFVQQVFNDLPNPAHRAVMWHLVYGAPRLINWTTRRGIVSRQTLMTKARVSADIEKRAIAAAKKRGHIRVHWNGIVRIIEIVIKAEEKARKAEQLVELVELKRLPDSEIPEWDVPDEWKPPEPEIPF
jgi:hypothetical protein